MATPDFVMRISGTEILNQGRLSELEDLINDFRDLGLDGEISYRPPTGRGLTWWQVTLIYIGGKALDAAGMVLESVIAEIRDKVIEWAKRRIRSGETSRPQSITLYGPDGKKLKTIRVNKELEIEEENYTESDDDSAS